MNITILKTIGEAGYELIDSGEGEKLERFGDFVVSRPDPQALWKKQQPESVWAKAQARFVRDAEKAVWKIADGTPQKWEIDFAGLRFWIRPTSFKHTGLFPEQSQNWNWITETIKNFGREKISVLNLFGYTGGATLAALRAGAEVVHVDGSKVALTWARENAELSGLAEKPVRWILDDALVFVRREIKRGKKYHGIIMDPPSFGHGPKGETWKIEEKFLELLDLAQQILEPEPLFFLINGYSAGYSVIAYENSLKDVMKEYSGTITSGELTIEETKTGRLLPSGIFTRWQAAS